LIARSLSPAFCLRECGIFKRIFAALPSNPAMKSAGYPTEIIEFRLFRVWNDVKKTC
jgi:hypothetical protein